jgi:hypothetical protein
MPSQPRKGLLQQRRRPRHDADDEASVVNDTYDDSASEPSLPSDADDDADADYSDLSEGDVPETSGSERHRDRPKTVTKHRSAILKSSSQPAPVRKAKSQGAFRTVQDTDVMLNGLSIADDTKKSEPIDFEAAEIIAEQQEKGAVKAKPESSSSDKKVRDNEEYKRKLESDPAFIPTRGAFFMHDHRTDSSGQNGFRAMRGGRGRGRNGPMGPFPPAT